MSNSPFAHSPRFQARHNSPGCNPPYPFNPRQFSTPRLQGRPSSPCTPNEDGCDYISLGLSSEDSRGFHGYQQRNRRSLGWGRGRGRGQGGGSYHSPRGSPWRAHQGHQSYGGGNGSRDEISLYFHSSMLEDPWTELERQLKACRKEDQKDSLGDCSQNKVTLDDCDSPAVAPSDVTNEGSDSPPLEDAP